MTRSKLRLFIIVFLVVILTGLGVSSAAALWSLKTNVVTQMTTGKWIDYSRPGFPMPLVPSVKDATFSGIGTRKMELSWTHDASLDPATQRVTYRVEAEENGRLRLRGRSLPYQGASTSISVETTTPIWPYPAESIQISITPLVNGVAGTSTVRTLWLDSNGSTRFESPR